MCGEASKVQPKLPPQATREVRLIIWLCLCKRVYPSAINGHTRYVVRRRPNSGNKSLSRIILSCCSPWHPTMLITHAIFCCAGCNRCVGHAYCPYRGTCTAKPYGKLYKILLKLWERLHSDGLPWKYRQAHGTAKNRIKKNFQ